LRQGRHPLPFYVTTERAFMPLTSQGFIEVAMTNAANREILSRLPALKLKECFLTAGCPFQAVWNQRSGRDAGWGVRDYDVFYFDDRDTSWEAEDVVIRQAQALFADLGVDVEVKNQARVHLWYERRFGQPYPRLTSARDGIDRYLISCTCIGIEASTGRLYAPYGFQDLHDGLLRMNPSFSQPVLYRRKARDYQARWPWLSVVDRA